MVSMTGATGHAANVNSHGGLMKREGIIAIVSIVSIVAIVTCSAFASGGALVRSANEPAQTQTSGQKKQYPNLPSETPDKFEPTNDGFDYIKRDVMIPMRDGVRLHTVILVPKGA